MSRFNSIRVYSGTILRGSLPSYTPWCYSNAESLRFITGSNEYDCYSANYVYASKYYIHASGIYTSNVIHYTTVTRGKTIWITVIMLFIYFTNRFNVHYYCYCYCGCALLRQLLVVTVNCILYTHQTPLIITLGNGLIKCVILLFMKCVKFKKNDYTWYNTARNIPLRKKVSRNKLLFSMFKTT